MKKTILHAAAATAAAVITAIAIVGCNGGGDVNDSVNKFLGSFDAPGLITFTLTTTADPADGGSISRDPDKDIYAVDEQVTVTAANYDHYTFTGWSGAVKSKNAAVTITMDGNKSLTAGFALNKYTLTTNLSIDGGGIIRREPYGEDYDAGKDVTVKVEPNEGYVFTGWSGALTSADAEVLIHMDGDKTLTANFIKTYKLTVYVNGNGSVSRDPDRLRYNEGAAVTVTAEPGDGYLFNGWSGKYASAEISVTVTMDGDKELTANFVEQVFTDGRDNTRYRIVVIGGKRWMAENLNYETDDSWCHDCGKFGRLYNWYAAMSVCPSGWRLPSRQDWSDLIAVVGSHAGTKLKSNGYWNHSDDYEGTDEFGFSALPGGYSNSVGVLDHVGVTGYWWTATASVSLEGAYNRAIKYNSDDVYEQTNGRVLGFSVRCIRD